MRGENAMVKRIQLHKFQRKIISKANELIQAGEKHISIIMPPGFGKTTMALAYAGEFASYKRVVYLNSAIQLKEYAQDYFEQNTINAKAETIRRFTNEIVHGVYSQEKEEIWLIDDAQAIEIKDLQIRLNWCATEVTTISFFNPYQSIANAEDMSLLLTRLDTSDDVNLNDFVFSTHNAIDLRSLTTEDPKECLLIRNKLAHSVTKTENRLLHARALQNELLLAQEENEINRQVIQRLKQENEKLECEKKTFNDRLVENQAQIDTLSKLCEIQSMVLSYLGISSEEISCVQNRIDEIRQSLKSQLSSPDNDEVEIAYQQLQNQTVEVISDIVAKSRDELSIIKITEQLREALTPSVWHKLSEKSQNFLITAKYTYENMIHLNGGDKLDYSGVCLLVTKAIEVETFNRFFSEYKRYLQQKFGYSAQQWPIAMTHKDRFGNIYPVRDFTLGSVIYIVKDTSDGLINRVFFDYAQKYLYENRNGTVDIEGHLLSICNFVETVRLDYRNPASHKDAIQSISATQCFDYVIDIEKQLRKMLDCMSH